jgi:hypothetical protein
MIIFLCFTKKYKEKEKADKGTGKEDGAKKTDMEAIVEKVSTYTVGSKTLTDNSY